jgi:hypothetical protein
MGRSLHAEARIADLVPIAEPRINLTKANYH